MCSNCKELPGNVSGVIRGVYHSGLCRSCYTILVNQTPSSGHAEYGRQRDFEDHQAEVAQPYTKDGKPSSDFIRLYPEQASTIFSESERRKYG